MSTMSELDIKVQESKGKKTHYIDTRLFNNAGLRFPTCKHTMNKLLDLEATRLPMSNQIHEVTCKNCIRLYFKGSRS